LFILCYLGKHNPSKQLSTIFVPSGKFIGRTFAFKKFFGVSKEAKERLPQPLLFRKTQPFEIPPTKFVPSGKFIGRTFAFKKVFGVSKEAKERISQPLIIR
jgi:hypothetical protein